MAPPRASAPPAPDAPATPDSPAPNPDPIAAFAADLQRYTASRNQSVGIAVLPVGRREPIVAGRWTTGVAWSTSKVPLVLVADRQLGDRGRQLSRAAITVSDNGAAMSLWSMVGPEEAARRMDAQAAAYGTSLHTQRRETRAGYTPFGQTLWSNADQARFMAGMACDAGAGPTLALMGQVSTDHRWGLGRLPGARFKGGWGPTLDGRDLQRQMGVIDLGRGPVAVAIAAETSDPSTGRRELDDAARWIAQRAAALPRVGCQR